MLDGGSLLLETKREIIRCLTSRQTIQFQDSGKDSNSLIHLRSCCDAKPMQGEIEASRLYLLGRVFLVRALITDVLPMPVQTPSQPQSSSCTPRDLLSEPWRNELRPTSILQSKQASNNLHTLQSPASMWSPCLLSAWTTGNCRDLFLLLHGVAWSSLYACGPDCLQ